MSTATARSLGPAGSAYRPTESDESIASRLGALPGTESSSAVDYEPSETAAIMSPRPRFPALACLPQPLAAAGSNAPTR
ncbi:MAG TPA: hypothetical protein DCQ98_08995 [Planctomycetaceae bacterium]|nr:hypothetical protein [Planctomycetaceae bacterium]